MAAHTFELDEHDWEIIRDPDVRHISISRGSMGQAISLCIESQMNTNRNRHIPA
jgi:hypothetical protein